MIINILSIVQIVDDFRVGLLISLFLTFRSNHKIKNQFNSLGCLSFSSECVCAKSFQSCPTSCNSMDCSPPGSSVHGILQTRILEWVAMPSSRGSFRPSYWTHILQLLHCGWILYCWATVEAHFLLAIIIIVIPSKAKIKAVWVLICSKYENVLGLSQQSSG